jgi:hypothetical protein
MAGYGHAHDEPELIGDGVWLPTPPAVTDGPHVGGRAMHGGGHAATPCAAEPARAMSQSVACGAFDAAVKIARESALRTFSQDARYCAWSARGSVLSPRCAQVNAAPSSAIRSSAA